MCDMHVEVQPPTSFISGPSQARYRWQLTVIADVQTVLCKELGARSITVVVVEQRGPSPTGSCRARRCGGVVQ
ncbi:hypothetical protein KTR9_1532 [Gordonia sp. KTR9]|nr:hypothetical protein KTR9_1532 [Gordonia sp. KTR9]